MGPDGSRERVAQCAMRAVGEKTSPRPPMLAVRPDNDYGLVWIRSYGNGRVFNCALGHSSLLFGTPPMAQLILNGIQFVLGDLEADATPSAKLPAKR